MTIKKKVLFKKKAILTFWLHLSFHLRTRSLKANNLKNREEIQQLREKVSTLEAALAAASTSSDSAGSLYISTDQANNKKPESDVGIDDTLNVFGSLSVEDEGVVFHGDTSMSEVCRNHQALLYIHYILNMHDYIRTSW